MSKRQSFELASACLHVKWHLRAQFRTSEYLGAQCAPIRPGTLPLLAVMTERGELLGIMMVDRKGIEMRLLDAK
jgi:hypothetical protein